MKPLNQLDNELISSLDQPIPYDPTDALNKIEEFYLEAQKDKEVRKVLNKAKEIIGGFRTSGLVLSKLLYMLKRDWDKFEINDVFEDVMMVELGISRITIQRYIGVWDVLTHSSLSEKVHLQLQAKPMKSLIPISKAIEQGYVLEEDVWEELANAPDDASVRNILREVKGQEPRKNSLTIYLERNGDLKAYMGKQSEFIGWVTIETTSEIVKKAVKRIIDGAGIVVR